MLEQFDSKAAARQAVWDRLGAEGQAREPLPAQGRIPNFAGARAAAVRLLLEAPWCRARALKINPDSPQRAVRLLALQRGIRVYVPTPGLAGGFKLLDPAVIPPARWGEAACRATQERWAQSVTLDELPRFDGIVAGSVAVTATGKRCGKGAGYSDLEFGLLEELGHPAVPVATTVHDLQLVEDFPVEAFDQRLGLICTPTRTLRVEHVGRSSSGIDWSRLDRADLEAMPLLAELRARGSNP